ALMRENVEAVRDAVLGCQRERGIAKPTYLCWVVGREGDENQAILQEAGIPVYEWPERTARTAAAIVAYSKDHHTRTAYQSMPEPPPAGGVHEQAANILARVRAQNRTLLLESEVKALLAIYGASIPRETLCPSPAEAVAAGQVLG